MSSFQLLLLVLSGVIFYIFFKKLFTEDYPKRGIDFEATTDDAQIGGISTPEKIFSRPTLQLSRIDQLITMADESVAKGDYLDAKKAIESALILDKDNHDILVRYGYILSAINDFSGAKEQYQKALTLNFDDDISHAALANVLHQLGASNEAIGHHEKSIELDGDYPPHFFNYANTLYDLKQYTKSLELYEKAYSLDPHLDEAKEMIAKLKGAKA